MFFPQKKEVPMTPVFFKGHAKRNAHLSKTLRRQFPDAIRVGGGAIFVRRKIKDKDYEKYSPTVLRMINAEIPFCGI